MSRAGGLPGLGDQLAALPTAGAVDPATRPPRGPTGAGTLLAGDRTIPDMLAAAAAAAPRSAAVVVDGTALSYAELADRVERLASWLVTMGVARGDRIALRAASGLLHFEVYLAAARIGAACVPLVPELAEPEVARLVADARPSLAFADEASAGALRSAGVDVVVAGDQRHRDALSAEADSPPALPEPSDTALVVYTSGTTGDPKGVCLSQAALSANAAMNAESQCFGDREVHLTSTPLHHTSAAARVFTMLDGAHTHVVLPRFEAGGWLDTVETHGVTSAMLVPTQVRRILDLPAYEPGRLGSLRLLVYGAAPSSPSQVWRMRQELRCGLYHGYGLSETVGVVCALTAADHAALSGPDDPRLGSVGRPIRGAEVVLRRPDGSEAAPGEVGEITVWTAKAMLGYWGDPAATADALADGWLATGDLGTVNDDGYITIVGRSKDIIISGGVNIHPAQIEEVIAGHPAVEEAAVFGVPHPEWGEAPAAAVKRTPDGAVAAAELGKLVATRLDRRWRPRRVVFVEDFPRTATGKIRRGDLPSLLD